MISGDGMWTPLFRAELLFAGCQAFSVPGSSPHAASYPPTPSGSSIMQSTRTVTVREIAEVLHEPELQMVARVLRTLGQDRCVELLASALTIEHQGGMLTKDGTRRSMGGIFLHLCREQATREERKRIFG
jgi:hypothetical protein